MRIHAHDRRCWYVRCRDSRMPVTPMTRPDALAQARYCDRRWPQCGPHEVFSGPDYHKGYE